MLKTRNLEPGIVENKGVAECVQPTSETSLPHHLTKLAVQVHQEEITPDLTSRRVGFLLLPRFSNLEPHTVVEALIGQSRKLADERRKSLTWDRSKELADHKRFTVASDIDVYF